MPVAIPPPVVLATPPVIVLVPCSTLSTLLIYAELSADPLTLVATPPIEVATTVVVGTDAVVEISGDDEGAVAEEVRYVVVVVAPVRRVDVKVVVVVPVGLGHAGREISEERPPAVRVIVSCAVAAATSTAAERKNVDSILSFVGRWR